MSTHHEERNGSASTSSEKPALMFPHLSRTNSVLDNLRHRASVSTCPEAPQVTLIPEEEIDAFGDEASADIQYKTCKWWHASILMMAENVSLGVLALPQALAILGLVPGILCIIFLGIIATYTGWIIGEFKLAHPSVQSYSDCGYILFGRIGREVFAVGQVLVLIFIMGAHVLTFAIALNVITDHSTCTVVFSFVGLLVSFLLGLPRTFKNVSYFSIFSCFSVVMAVTVAMIAISIERPGFGHIIAVRPDVTLVHGLSPVMNIILAYAGHVGFFSFQAELEDPRDFKKALFLEQVIAITFYSLISIVIYYYAGPLVASPALGSTSFVIRKVCFGICLGTIVIAGVINGSVACKYIYLRVWKGTDVVHETSFRSLASWWGICAACWIASWLLAEAIPNFNLLLGLIGALFGSWFSYAIPPLLSLHLLRGEFFTTKRNAALTVINVLVALLGVAIFALGMWSSGWELNHGTAGRVFGCANNWHPMSWAADGAGAH